VTIAFKEDFGIGERAGYFESTGIVHDVLQNHMLQMFSLFAMEPPVTLRAEDVRDEKVKLLRAVQPVRPEDIVVGQYVKSESKQTGAGQKQQNGDGNGGKDDQESSDRAAAADAQRAEGESYRAEPGVAADSNTPTFCALVLRVENARWSGVPFIMKCGKALNEGKTEIRIQFKRPANSLFHDLARDELVIKVKPDDSVYLKVCSKLPGLSGPIAMTELDFTVSDRFPEAARDTPEAYERLLWDVTLGDRSLFVRSDELMQSWRLVAPVTAAIEAGLKAGTGADGRVELTPTGTQLGDAGTKAAGSTSGGGSVRGGNGVRPMRLYAYKRGTRGPVEADALAARHGFETTSGMYSWVSPGERRQRAGAEKGDSGGAQGGKGGEGGK
jgi:glucose-6-phosphate 1-dehydrogenase